MTSGGRRPGDSKEGSGLLGAAIPCPPPGSSNGGGGNNGTKISPVFEQNSASSSGKGGNPMAGGASADTSECCSSGSGLEGAGSGSGCSGSDSSSSRRRPGKLGADVHAAMTARLVRWAEDENPGRSMPGRAEKDRLADECGVSARSIEYWFWARNKRLRGAATCSPSQSPGGGSRKRGRSEKPPTLAPLPPINPEEAADRADGGVGLSFFEQHEQHHRQQQVQEEAAAATTRVAEDEYAAAGDNEDSDADEEENYSHSRRYSLQSPRHSPRGRRHSPHGSQLHRSPITNNGFKYDFGAKKMMISAAAADDDEDEDEDHDGKDNREGQTQQQKPLPPSDKAGGLTRRASGGLGASTPCSLSDVLSGSSPTSSSLMSVSSPQASWHTAIVDEEEEAITTSAEASAVRCSCIFSGFEMRSSS